MIEVAIEGVAAGERGALFAMLGEYLQELDAYELEWDPAPPLEAYRGALEDFPDEQALWWIVAGGRRAGFAITREDLDWPEERTLGVIVEFYVAPEARREGVGRAAVELLLAGMRERGVAQVEASVLARNGPARGFWGSLGFEDRAVQTVRRP